MLMIESKIVTHSPTRKDLNHREELFLEGFELYRVEVDRLSELAWSADVNGLVNKAYTYYKAIATFQLMHSYVELMWLDQERTSPFRVSSVASYLVDKYKTTCIDKNLPCKSRKACTDYTNAWEDMLKIYGIDLLVLPEEDCCIGIGRMIIEDQDDCKSFILSSCTELSEDMNKTVGTGDFDVTDFNNDLTIKNPT